MDFEQEYQKTERLILEYQERVRGCMVFRRLKASEDWAVVRQWLTDQLAAKQASFAALDADLSGFKQLQAEVKAFQAFLTMGDVKPDDLDRWQREITRLQKAQVSRQNYGLDKNHPAQPERQPT